MQAIKALVIGMGVLIVAGMALLGYGFYAQSGKAGKGARPAPAAATGVPVESFGEVAVPLGPDGRVVEVLEAEGRLAVRIAEPHGERIVVLDPASGTVAGSFVLRQAAPGAIAPPGAVPLR